VTLLLREGERRGRGKEEEGREKGGKEGRERMGPPKGWLTPHVPNL